MLRQATGGSAEVQRAWDKGVGEEEGEAGEGAREVGAGGWLECRPDGTRESILFTC